MAASQPEAADTDLINLLITRDGAPTLVSVLEGDTFTVFNIASGYDFGDEYAHVTTNVSPFIPDVPIDVFSTDRVNQVCDASTGTVLYSHNGTARGEP
jgi:hypothetical protein